MARKKNKIKYHDNTIQTHTEEKINDESLKIELELEKANKKDSYLKQIHVLYEDVIEKFRLGNLSVYNPNIFSKLTEQQFANWIINNNKEITDLFI